MSNYKAIAAITATLIDVLQEAVQDISGATVMIQRPEKVNVDVQEKPAINVYLYQVTTNSSWSNEDLPTRTSNGSALQRPTVALNLNYVLSFHGSELTMEPQLLLGHTVSAFYGQPVLQLEMIQNAINNRDYLKTALPDVTYDQSELVRVSRIDFSLEELSRLWSVFFQVPYTLSVAYRVAPVLIQAPASLYEPQRVAVGGVRFPPRPGDPGDFILIGDDIPPGKAAGNAGP
jgi:hypothetical protein